MKKYRIKEEGDWYFVQVRYLFFFWNELVGCCSLKHAKAWANYFITCDYKKKNPPKVIYHDYP